MKKIVCILLCLVTMLFASACSDGRAEAEKTAVAFMDAYCELNLKDASLYIENKDSFTLPFENFDSMIETIKTSMETEEAIAGMDSYVEKFIIPVYTKYVEMLSYSITGTEKEEDKFIVNISLESINAENISTDELNFEEIMSELATELTENGTLTSDMSQDDFLAIIMEHTPEKMASHMITLIENAGTETKEIKLVIKNTDGEYLITDEGDLSLLLSEAGPEM